MLVMRQVTVPGEGIQHKEENTKVFLEEKDCGTGTLHIAESCLCWVSSTGEGLSFEYPNICLHAISRDTSSFPHSCIYMQVGLKLVQDETTEEDEDEGTGPEEDIDPCTVVRFVPQNTDNLQHMFQALSDCQTLHPDPDDSEEETEYFNSAGDTGGLSTQGLITLQRLENMLQTSGETGHDNVITANGDANGMGDGQEYDEAMEDEEEEMDQ